MAKFIQPLGVKVFEYDELEELVKLKVLESHIRFLMETYNPAEDDYIDNVGRALRDAMEEAERNHTPWFMGEILYERYREVIEEDIRINKYYFYEDGKLVPLTFCVNKGEIKEILYDGKIKVNLEEE